MRASLQNIVDIMEKESRLGYGDFAVFGGFSSFVTANLTLWPGPEHPLAQEAMALAAGYDKAPAVQRARILARLHGLVNELDREDRQHRPANGQPPEPTQPSRPGTAPPPAAAPVSSAAKKPAAPKAAAKSKATENPLQWIKGVGPKRAQLLNKMGLRSVADLTEFYPRRHEDRRRITPLAELVEGEAATVRGWLGRVDQRQIRRGLHLIRAEFRDDSGYLPVIWFNQPWLGDKLRPGAELTVYGRLDLRGDRRQFVAAECLTGDETFGILPVYSLTEGITQKAMRGIVQSALSLREGQIPELLPAAFRERLELAPREWAIRRYHFPADLDELARARRRLVFEEFFLLRLAFSRPGQVQQGMAQTGGTDAEFLSLLPFTLTGAQSRAMKEIWSDMAAPRRMVRLLEGDVGSGKTAVAAAAVWRACRSGGQAALMAPTEILAAQHYRSLSKLFEQSDLRVALLTGTAKAKERAAVANGLAEGTIHLIVGTHALIEEEPAFRRLTLVVVDEQHRFGVDQRERLAAKGQSPDLLILTATPIPRTLAMTVFGDLDISVLNEAVPGRQPVKTYVVKPQDEARVLNFIRKQVAAGGQAYIICPLVAESESLDLAAAEELYDTLKLGVFRDLRVGLIHGRLRGADKNRVMREFAAGQLDVLVATTVIEVGVDVPNATVMLVRDAHRFGLAQLHQMRGRIGRSDKESWCILENGGHGGVAAERLAIMAQCSDGFRIAEEDLRLRGPGDFFGTRQHGLAELKIADLYVDHDILAVASREADALLRHDPQLAAKEWLPLRQRLAEKYTAGV